MKSIASSLAAFVIAAAALAAAAAPAQAGLDFTDTASNASGGSADFTFNGATGTSTTVSMNNGFGGTTNATISSNLASGTIGPTTARVEFSYNNGFGNGIFGATYAMDVGNPVYDLVVEFGTITLAGTNGSAQLQSIDFLEAGGGFTSVFNVNQSIDASFSNQRVHIFIPSTGAGSIPLSERDLAQIVRLTFLFTGGSGTSINISAVANPEPGTMALFGLGLAGLAGAVRARRKSRARAKTA